MKLKFPKKLLVDVFMKWLTFAGVIVALSGLVYVTGQQILRLSANDPQIQLTEDIANSLIAGNDPKSLGGGQTTDIATSLAPFLIVYDDAGKVVATTATLSGSDLVLPGEVLAAAKNKSDDRVTWEPVKGVREAVVVKYYKTDATSGYVLVGRSLREIELREERLLKMSAIGAAATLAGQLLVLLVLELARKKHSS